MFTDSNLQKVVSQSPVVLFVIDNSGIFQVSLGKGLETLGLKQNQVVGLSVFDVYKDMPSVLKQYETTLKGTTTTEILQIGDTFFESTMSPNIDDSGSQIGVIGLATDITEKVHINNKLKQNTELYDTITKVSKDVVWTMDLNGKFFYVSPNVELIRGFTPEEVMKQSFEEVIYFEDIPLIQSELAKVGQMIAEGITSQAPVFMKVRQPHKNGSIIHTDVQVSTVFDDNGNFKYFLGVTRDITDQIGLEIEKENATRLYKLLFEFANDGIFFMRDLKFIDVNHKITQMIGYTREEMSIMTPKDFSPEYQPDGQKSIDKAKSVIEKAISGHNQIFEWMHIKKNGEEILVEVSLSNAVYNGEPTIIGLWRDVTEHNRLLDELKESEERLTLTIDGTNDGIWDWNLTTNELFLSKRWKNIIGYSDDELENYYNSWADNIHQDDKPLVIDLLNAYLEGKVDKYEPEFRMRHKDGHYVHILAKGKIIRDDNGNPIRMLGTHSDITEKKQLEQDISLFFSNSIELVSISNTDGTFVTLNEMWTKVLGWSLLELMSKPFIEFVHKDDLARTNQEMQKLFSGIDVFDFRNRYLCKDGSYKWLSWHSKFVKDRGLIFANARDISEQIKAEEQLLELNNELELRVEERTEELESAYRKLEESLSIEKKLNDMQSKFINIISHEYKTPITSISTSAEILKYYHNHDDPDATKNIDRILSSAKALTNLIENVINYQKILDGNYKPFLVPIEINQLISDIVEQYRIINLDRFNFVYEPLESNLNILSDKKSITQIIGEFITNSMKYSPMNTAIVVSVREDSKYLHISVKDSGIGIKQDDINNLFTPFFKSDESIGLKPGTGVGLAVAKKLATSINAEINLESTPNSGSIFTLTLSKF
jgi:PAS domain S-box-containing protein